mmetsp:Transcript_112451/g.349014  ORF Transcript_112451/g.349014 Transcript_112451/m.349014 type:complete len:234 (+) Transcript_112451:982-1683(+)
MPPVPKPKPKAPEPGGDTPLECGKAFAALKVLARGIGTTLGLALKITEPPNGLVAPLEPGPPCRRIDSPRGMPCSTETWSVASLILAAAKSLTWRVFSLMGPRDGPLWGSCGARAAAATGAPLSAVAGAVRLGSCITVAMPSKPPDANVPCVAGPAPPPPAGGNLFTQGKGLWLFRLGPACCWPGALRLPGRLALSCPRVGRDWSSCCAGAGAGAWSSMLVLGHRCMPRLPGS